MRALPRAFLALPLAALLAAPAARAAGDAIDEEVSNFKTYLSTKPAADGLKNKIAELGTKKDPRIADVLLPLATSGQYDEEVRAQACLSIGKQGSTKVLGVLASIVDMKKYDEEKPKLVAAAMEAIGEIAPEPKFEYLVKMGNKYLDSNGEISSAAWKGVGNSHSNAAVEALVKAAVRCDASGGDKPVPAEVRANRGAAKGVIFNCLQKITGQDIKDSSVWDKWWRDNKKTFKPSVGGEKADINASDTFKDTAYSFSVKKPSKVWVFRKGDGRGAYLRVTANEEGNEAAWVEVYVDSVKGKTLTTPEQFVEADKGLIEPKFRDLKESDWSKKCSYGGLKGLESVLLGQHKDFDAVYMHNVYLEKNEIMYRFYCVWKSGKAQALKDDILTMLKSGIKFLDS